LLIWNDVLENGNGAGPQPPCAVRGFEKNLMEGLLSALFRAGSYLLDYEYPYSA